MGRLVCLTIQTFFMVLFLSTVIIKLVSDGLVQFLTPRPGDETPRVFSRQEEMWYAAHMNGSPEPGASQQTPLTLDHVHVAIRARLIFTPGSFLT